MFQNKFKLLLVVTLVSVLAVTSLLYFVNNSSSSNDSDTPPVLSLAGQSLQGQIEKGAQGFLQFEEEDEDDFDDFKDDYEDEHDDADTITLNAGVNYVSPLEDISVEELINCINPEADRVLLAQYDADEGKFLTYPKGPFGDDTERIDDTDYEFEAGKGLVIIARQSADAYCIAEAEEQSDVDVTHPMDEDVRGWVLLHSNEDTVEDLIKPYEDRVDLVWKMTDDNEFDKVKESDYDEDLEDFYMVWMKLSKGENGGDDVNGDVAPKELSFTAQAGTSGGLLTWKVSPDTYKDKDITGYMLSVREDGQSANEAVETYVTESDWTERNGVITLVLGEIVAGDVYLVRVGAVYDGEKDQPYYTEEIRVTIEGTDVVADLNVVPMNVSADDSGERDVNGDGKINLTDLRVGVSWTRVSSVEGRTVNGYVVKYSVCDNVNGVGQNCEEKPQIVVPGANTYQYVIDSHTDLGTIYKVSVAADIEQRTEGLKFSDEVVLELPALEEISPNDLAQILENVSSPMNLRVTAVANGSVTLAWDVPTGDGADLVQGYEVMYMPLDFDKNFEREDDRSVKMVGKVNTVTIDGLVADGQQYAFALEVKGLGYNGEYFSNYVFAVPKANATVYPAPIIDGAVTDLDNNVVVNWHDAANLGEFGGHIDGYIVFVKDDKRYFQAEMAEKNERSVEFDNLEAGSYEFAVVTVYELNGKKYVSGYSEWKVAVPRN